MNLDRIGSGLSIDAVEGFDGTADAFAGPGATDVTAAGLSRKLAQHVQVSGIELALANHQRDSAKKVIDSLT